MLFDYQTSHRVFMPAVMHVNTDQENHGHPLKWGVLYIYIYVLVLNV